MSIYKHLKYQEILLSRIEHLKSQSSLTMAKLAEKVGVQSSYITHVFKGRAHFSADQLYAIGEALNFSEEEVEYLLLLLELERSVHSTRKRKLKEKIELQRAKFLKTESHLSVETVRDLEAATIQYYLDPLCQLVMVFLNFPQYAKDPFLLGAKLGMGSQQLEEILGRLQSSGKVEITKNGYKVLSGSDHLPKESPLCQPHQTLMRYKSVDQMQRLAWGKAYSFSVTFSSTPEDKAQIQSAFLDFVNAAEKIVKKSPREKVYQINFDLFPWELD